MAELDIPGILGRLKTGTFEDASRLSVAIRRPDGTQAGRLVPVGEWSLKDPDKVQKICDWRQKFMRMFLVQFESTPERTLSYLRDLSIGERNRIFFLIYDDEDRFVGHVGMSGIGQGTGELDNLVRGEDGGDPRLIYLSEVALLDWCFRELGLATSNARILSYNWMAASLHDEVGYAVVEKIPLRRREQDAMVFHDPVEAADANVRYSCLLMVLRKDDFYAKAPWLVDRP